MYEAGLLAPKGSTGNNTGSAYSAYGAYDAIAFQFVVEAVGSTPTVTWKIQGSADGTNWYDVLYITPSTDTGAITALTATAVGSTLIFLSNPVARRYKSFRVVTSANTNVTYRTEIYPISS